MNFINKVIPSFPLLLIAAVFIFPLLRPGLIVGGDWTFPSSNKELQVFGQRAFSIWGRLEIPSGTQISHNNLYPVQILARLWAGIGLSGVSFQKSTLFLTIIGIYVFSYRLFVKLTKSKFASIVGALSYLFSPIVFNYLNMGWNYVLLFLALAPLFVQIGLDYFEDGKSRHIIALGLLAAISFFQSQSIIWLPLIFICIFVSQTTRENLSKSILKLMLASVGIGLIVTIVHLPWLLLIVLHPNNILVSTSSVDLKRFSEVLSISDLLRLWGSLYNREFELAFPLSLSPFSYSPIIICIIAPLFSHLKNKLTTYLLMLLLVIIAPTLFINREFIAHIPLSTIIRDISRFLVITSLGVSLGIALALSVIRNKIFRVVICIMLIISASPFFLGRLYTLTGNPTPQAEEYRDFRAALLSIPEIENEPATKSIADKTNVFLPTAGFVFTRADHRFNREYWAVADVQSNFSPVASGIYFSEKSDFLVSNFALNYLTLSSNIDNLTTFFGVFGVDNLLYRSGLESTYKSTLDRDGILKRCQPFLPQGNSDWSITSLCLIKDAYPLIYSSITPQYSNESFTKLLPEFVNLKVRTVVLGCPEKLKEKSSICNIEKISDLAKTIPTLSITKISETKYRVGVENIKGKFILVLNQTYHPGWIIQNRSGERQDYPHVLVNHLVNGWVVDPATNQEKEDYIITFYPQVIYSRLLPISLISLLAMVVYLTHQSKQKNEG